GDDADAADEGEWERALRVVDLAGELREVRPAVVGPERGDECGHEAGDARVCGEVGCREIVQRAVAEAAEADDRDADDENDLEPGECGLDVRGFARADDVERGDEPGGDDRGYLRPEQMREGGLGEEAERREVAEYAHKAGGERGNGRRLGDGDPGPGVEEGGEVAVGFADEGVLATDAGAKRGDFGVAHGAEEREQAADDPDDVDDADAAGGGHHLARDEEDAGADDDADDDRDRV